MAGSCMNFGSFLHKRLYRTQNQKYNTEQGYFAAMCMLDKRLRFQVLNQYNLSMGEDKPIFYIGEKCSPYHEMIFEGDPEKDDRFIIYYVYGDEITGILTFGYHNLHIYLHEGMKQFVMPTATELKLGEVTHKDIVHRVIMKNDQIRCKRPEIMHLRSVILAEQEEEIEQSEALQDEI